MDNEVLTLKQGAVSFEQDGRFGIKLGGHMKLAADDRESLLLRTLIGGPQTTADLTELLRAENGPASEDAYAALKLAEFILNFEKYLES